MDGFILVPEKMRGELVKLVKSERPGWKSVLAVLKMRAVEIPIEYEFRTDDGDRFRVVAWSEREAREQVKQDRRFPGNLHLESTCPAWPGTGVTRIVCPDEEEPDAA